MQGHSASPQDRKGTEHCELPVQPGWRPHDTSTGRAGGFKRQDWADGEAALVHESLRHSAPRGPALWPLPRPKGELGPEIRKWTGALPSLGPLVTI